MEKVDKYLMETKKVDKSDTKIQTNQEENKSTEQFCSCCKPVDFFDFLVFIFFLIIYV